MYLLQNLLEKLSELTALNAEIAKRAKHVITENQRVLDAMEALQQGDLRRLGKLDVTVSSINERRF